MKSREQSLFAGLLQKQNRTQLAIILGVVAMLLILFSELFSTPAKTAANAGSSAAVSETAYREQLETQLTELIEQLDGAGKTVVMVTLESGEETIYAVDTQSGQMQNQETHVLLEDGSALEETTYLPAVCGVAVVCDGGGDVRVAARITELVRALLDLSANRICVEEYPQGNSHYPSSGTGHCRLPELAVCPHRRDAGRGCSQRFCRQSGDRSRYG